MRAFVIRPFGEKTDSAGSTIDFEKVHNDLIAPALKAAGLDGGTTGASIDAGNIREDMFALIIEADLVVADVTVHTSGRGWPRRDGPSGPRMMTRRRCASEPSRRADFDPPCAARSTI
jgi:hypothetical protein